MERRTSKVSFAIVLLAVLELFILNPSFATSDCYGVWDGDYEIKLICEDDEGDRHEKVYLIEIDTP